MAKRYPENRSLSARIECLVASHTHMVCFLQTLKTLNSDLGLNLPEGVIKSLDDALAKADEASRAVSDS